MATDEDAILCVVCCDIYDDPRSLPCGHSFCLKCIKGTADNNERFPCPICRYDINPKDGDVNKLPKNYGLSVVVEAKDKTQYVKCSKHTKLLDIFCETCDMVMCSKCLSTEHKGHVTEDVDKVYKERKDKLATLLAVTRFWALLMQEKKDLIQHSGDSLQSEADSINKSVDMFFKKWHDALNVQQNTIVSYLKEETNKKIQICYEAERALMTSVAKVKELEDEMNETLSSDRMVLVQRYSSIKERHATVGQSVIEDNETCFKKPDDLQYEVRAPWIDEAICNINVIDINVTKENFITQKISEIQEENTILKREKEELEMIINDLKLPMKRKTWKFKKVEDKEEIIKFSRRSQHQGQIDKDVDQKWQLDRDLLQKTSERLKLKEKELEDYKEREANLISLLKEEESKWNRQSETQRQQIEELQQKINELLNR